MLQLNTGTTALQHSRRLTLIFDLEQVLSTQVLIRRVAPELLAHKLMQLLSKGFSQTISNGLHHDVIEVITLQMEYTDISISGVQHRHALSYRCTRLLGDRLARKSSQVQQSSSSSLHGFQLGLGSGETLWVREKPVCLSVSDSGVRCHVPSMTKQADGSCRTGRNVRRLQQLWAVCSRKRTSGSHGCAVLTCALK